LCGVALVGSLAGAYISEKLLGHSTRSPLPWVIYVALAVLGGCFLDLAPTRGLATMAISLTVVGVAAFTIPAALIAQRIGRRRAFAAASALAASALLVAALALVERSFWL